MSDRVHANFSSLKTTKVFLFSFAASMCPVCSFCPAGPHIVLTAGSSQFKIYRDSEWMT